MSRSILAFGFNGLPVWRWSEVTVSNASREEAPWLSITRDTVRLAPDPGDGRCILELGDETTSPSLLCRVSNMIKGSESPETISLDMDHWVLDQAALRAIRQLAFNFVGEPEGFVIENRTGEWRAVPRA